MKWIFCWLGRVVLMLVRMELCMSRCVLVLVVVVVYVLVVKLVCRFWWLCGGIMWFFGLGC